MINAKALVVLSGGQDSITCLGWAKLRYAEVEAISFRYNQRHAIELACAAFICQKWGVKHRIVDLATTLSDLVYSRLTGTTTESAQRVEGLHPDYKDLPASFVPGRNALFLTYAFSYAITIGATALVTGVCQLDYAGYPDCREAFITRLEDALNIGYRSEINDKDIHIETPLMNLDKAQTFKLAEEIGCLDDVIKGSHTCYNGDHEHLHDWGYGCGECGACRTRADGYALFIARKDDVPPWAKPTPVKGGA